MPNFEPTEGHPFEDAEHVVEAELDKENSIFAFIGEVGRRRLFQIRKTWFDRNSGEWKPGKGLAINADPGEVLEVLQTALETYNQAFGTNLGIVPLDD